jgi:hypothetical protein
LIDTGCLGPSELDLIRSARASTFNVTSDASFTKIYLPYHESIIPTTPRYC